MTVKPPETIPRIQFAVTARSALFDVQHSAALRLFNGFSEGCPGLVIDLYAQTLVIFNQLDKPEELEPLISLIQRWLLAQYPWIRVAISKTRQAAEEQRRRGVLAHGEQADRVISESGVQYAVDLTMKPGCQFLPRYAEPARLA